MSDNEKETQVAEETQNTQAAAEATNEDRKSRRGQRGEGRRGERRNRREESHENEMLDRVVTINRVSKTHKGGRTFSFAALVVVGDGKGTVGVGYGKSREVPAAIAKGQLDAKKHMFTVPRIKGTVTHPVIGHDAAGTVLLRPAAPGTGVIAGGAVRAVMECAGITDVLTKSMAPPPPLTWCAQPSTLSRSSKSRKRLPHVVACLSKRWLRTRCCVLAPKASPRPARLVKRLRPRLLRRTVSDD